MPRGFKRVHKSPAGQAERARAADVPCVPCVRKQGTINTLQDTIVGERARANALLHRLKTESDAAAAAAAADAKQKRDTDRIRNANRRKADARRLSLSAVEKAQAVNQRWRMSQEAFRKRWARRAGKVKHKKVEEALACKGGGKAEAAWRQASACASERGRGREQVHEGYLRR